MPNSRVRFLAVVAAAAFGASAAPRSSAAAEEWKWPERGKNLQVLPKDFPPEKLQAVMKGFARSLGVRCPYCHAGQEGKPLSTYDFVSDQNPNKDRAREMYRMLGDINGHLKKIPQSGDRRVNMWCHTCHAGRPRPMTLEEELAESQRRGGIEAALARYHELRERYFGRAGYDFSQGALDDFARDRLEAKDLQGAIAIFQANAKEFPSSGDAWESLGEGYEAGGKHELARISYRKALELDPDNEEALRRLRDLDAAAAPPPR